MFFCHHFAAPLCRCRQTEDYSVSGHFGNSEKSACAKNAQAEIVLIRPISADLDYAFNKMAISCEKLFLIRANSPELD